MKKYGTQTTKCKARNAFKMKSKRKSDIHIFRSDPIELWKWRMMQKQANTPTDHLAISRNKHERNRPLFSHYIGLVLPCCTLIGEIGDFLVWRHNVGSLSLEKLGRETTLLLRARGCGQSMTKQLQPPCNVFATSRIKKPCCPSSNSIFHLLFLVAWTIIPDAT